VFLSWLWIALAAAEPFVVDVLDVGQGDAILLRSAGKTVLIDAGDRDAPTVEHLRLLDVHALDLVVSTHPHADHIGRMDEVIEAFDVVRFMDNGQPHTTQTYRELMAAVDERDVQRITAVTGMTLSLGEEVQITVLNPPTTPLVGTRSDLNSNSVVLRVDHREVSFLFTGDAEEPSEQVMIRQGIDPVDVLKVAHHGSDHSTTRGFIGAVDPSIAVISCGADNRYHHPGDETVKRLEDAEIWTLRTDQSGHLRLVSDGEEVEVFEGELAELGPYWPVDPPPITTPVIQPVATVDPVLAPPPATADPVVATGRISSGLMPNREGGPLTRAEKRRQRQAEKRLERERKLAEKQRQKGSASGAHP